MLIHIVCFKYKTDASEAVRREHVEKLRSLAGEAGTPGIPGIIALTVGADIVHSPRSYDTGLVIRFPDRAALDIYQKHPRHVPVAQHGVTLCEQIVSVDFEQ